MTTENTITQVNLILDQIGTAANALRAEIIASSEDSGNGDRMYALQSLASQIGWLADLGLEKTTGSPSIVGDAEDWFMPPSYHDAKRLEVSE